MPVRRHERRSDLGVKLGFRFRRSAGDWKLAQSSTSWLEARQRSSQTITGRPRLRRRHRLPRFQRPHPDRANEFQLDGFDDMKSDEEDHRGPD